MEYRAYVNYYQWLSPFHPDARNHIKNNAKRLMEIDGLESVHLDYVRYPDVILGADLQPKYGIVQDKELPEYDYGYHPIARKKFKEIFEKDPLDYDYPELSTEWRQNWIKKLSYYDSIGISEILVGGNPDVIEKIVPLAKKSNIKVHGWMWTLNRPVSYTHLRAHET